MNKTLLLSLAFLYTACAPAFPTKETFDPTEGTWMANSFEVTENECNFETTDQTDVTMVLARSDDGFTISFDDGAPYRCTLSGQDFECEEPASLTGESDPDSEVELDITTTGSFASQTELELRSRVSLICLVDDCADSEALFGTSIPCATATEIGMSFTE